MVPVQLKCTRTLTFGNLRVCVCGSVGWGVEGGGGGGCACCSWVSSRAPYVVQARTHKSAPYSDKSAPESDLSSPSYSDLCSPGANSQKCSIVTLHLVNTY